VKADADFDLVAIGEPLVEFNQTGADDGRQYLQGFGGDTSNAAIAAARQGARTAYFTRLGDDEFGRMCLALWTREGVDAGTVQLDAQAPTGLYFVTHGAQGHAFTYRRGGSAASRMRPRDIPQALIRRSRILHVSGISQAISEDATAAVRHAVEVARAAGTQVAYDPNLRLALWPLERAREVILATMPLADCFLPSLDDVRALSGRDAPHDILDWCHAHGARQVVLKIGPQGAIVSRDGARTPIAPCRVEAVDATGAGDCFDGTLLARWAAGDALPQAARHASVAAALATTGYGAVAPLPTSPQVAARLSLQPE
jgi:2-dehydro-3-deoxygluconokinase